MELGKVEFDDTTNTVHLILDGDLYIEMKKAIQESEGKDDLMTMVYIFKHLREVMVKKLTFNAPR